MDVTPQDPAPRRRPGARPRARRGPFGILVRWTGGLFKFIIAAAIFLALVTMGSYWLIAQYIRGEETVVPDLTGLAVDRALEQLQPMNVSLKLEDSIPHETIPWGNIVSQYPPAGSRIKRGTSVSVVRSAGLPLLVPDLRGQTLFNARRELHKAGLEEGNRTHLVKEGVAVGLVLETDPPAGTGVIPNSRVNLMVSSAGRDAPRTMPDLRGQTVGEAKSLLAGYDLQIAEQTEAENADAQPGEIHAQTPEPGAPLAADTRVTITFAPLRPKVPLGGEGAEEAAGNGEDAGKEGDAAQTETPEINTESFQTE